MKIIVLRNIFRFTVLITLVFMLFFVDKFNYTINLYTYIIGAISLAGMVIPTEIVVYFIKKRNQWKNFYTNIHTT